MDQPNSDSNDSYSATVVFPYKTWWNHLCGVLSRPIKLSLITISTLGGIWLIIETADQFFELNPKGVRPYLMLIAVAFTIGIVWQIFEYVNTCPDGFERVSRRARRIAHIQRPKWEYQLAKALLAERLAPIDRECRELLAAKEYVFAAKPRNISEYWTWLSARTDNLGLMLKIARYLLCERLPSAMVSTSKRYADPKNILDAVAAMERFYKETVRFERSSHAMIPPEGFERVHDLQIGWSEPIRDAILQMFQKLQQICELDPDSDVTLNLIIEFKEMPNVEEFGAELDRVGARLPELFSNEFGIS